jgi:hypothetical protein
MAPAPALGPTATGWAFLLTGRSAPAAHGAYHLLGRTVSEDWDAMGERPASLPAPALVVLDGEIELTASRCACGSARDPALLVAWHLPHGLSRPLHR